MANETSRDLYKALIRLFRQSARLLRSQMHGKHDFHRGQGPLLLLILRNDGLSQGELAELMDIRPSSMTELVSRMEQSELITRRQDEKDQRVMRIYLTEKGKKEAESAKDIADEFAGFIENALTEEETAQLLALVNKLGASMQEASSSDDELIFRGPRFLRARGFFEDERPLRHHPRHGRGRYSED